MINKSKLDLKVAVSIAALVFSLPFASTELQAQALTNSQPAFVENFTDPSASSKQWDQSTNGGTLLFSKGSVFLKGVGGGYPVMRTKQNPFPISGDWTASFGYRYTSVGNYGTELSCLGSNGEKVADIHQDVNGQLLQAAGNVSQLKPSTEWHVVSFVATGNHLAVYLDGQLTGERTVSVRPVSIFIGGGSMQNPWDWNDLQVALISVTAGKHVLDKNALHLDQQPAEASTQTTSFLSHEAAAVNVREDDKSLFCVMGDSVHLAGNTSGQHRLNRRSLQINGQPFTDLPANPNEDGYNFDWKPTSPGNYHLDVSFTLANPFGVVTAKSVDVTVLPKAPLALQQFSGPIPASCSIVAQSVDSSMFHPARVEFFLNDQSVGTANQAPFQVTLPISKQSPGSYTVSYQAYDAQGARWNGESETVTVPLRVKLTTPSAVTLASEKEQTHFTADIVPGLKIVRVDYSVDGQRVASTTVAPYDGSASLSAFKSGSHSVKSEVLVEDGETFCNPPTTLTLTNQPDDARLAKIAKDESDRQALLQKQEAERQASVTKQAADEVAAKVAAEVSAKQQEEAYKKEIADYTVVAVKQNLISVALDGNISKFNNCYLFTLKVTNRGIKTIGPLMTEIRFDDFSFDTPLAYNGTIPEPFDENGFPVKYLQDDYHDLVVPGNTTKSFNYFVLNSLSSQQVRKPTRISFIGTLRVLSIPLNPY